MNEWWTILVGSAFLYYLCIHMNLMNKAERYIMVPRWLGKILFPFGNKTKYRLDSAMLELYTHISLVIAYAFIGIESVIRANGVEYHYVNMLWIAVSIGALAIAEGSDMIYEAAVFQGKVDKFSRYVMGGILIFVPVAFLIFSLFS